MVPEIEAIATAVLVELEAEGLRVVPTARAARLTMDREGIRRLAAEELGLPTSPYRFGDSLEELRGRRRGRSARRASSSRSCRRAARASRVVRAPQDDAAAWDYAQTGGRTGAGRVIVEGFVDVRLRDHAADRAPRAAARRSARRSATVQVDGDYRESWQPQPMSAARAGARSRDRRARSPTRSAATGIFGVELFVRGDEVLFSEVSPRPHDTGHGHDGDAGR